MFLQNALLNISHLTVMQYTFASSLHNIVIPSGFSSLLTTNPLLCTPDVRRVREMGGVLKPITQNVISDNIILSIVQFGTLETTSD